MWLNTNWHVALGLMSKNQTAAAQKLITATVDTVDAWYHEHGVVFEFYDAFNATDPTILQRKGHASGGIRDYHWTAALTLAMLLELEHGGTLVPDAQDDALARLDCTRGRAHEPAVIGL